LTNEQQKFVRRRLVVPGEKLAVVEEFTPGPGTIVYNGQVLASAYGIAEYNHEDMTVSINPIKNNVGRPTSNEIVEGIVDAIQVGHAIVTIHKIGDRLSSHRFSALLPLRRGRKGERSITIKRGDIVRAKVESTLNATVYLSIDGENLGVIRTTCSNCGGEVIHIPQKNVVECINCGLKEPRSLAKYRK
jgi:exosome complex component CSL4